MACSNIAYIKPHVRQIRGTINIFQKRLTFLTDRNRKLNIEGLSPVFQLKSLVNWRPPVVISNNNCNTINHNISLNGSIDLKGLGHILTCKLMF